MQEELPQSIYLFLRSLAHELQPLSEESEELEEEIIEDLALELNDYISTEIVKTLPEEQSVQYIDMIEQDEDPATIEKFIAKHIKDPEEFYAKRMLEFKEAYLLTLQKKGLR